MKETRGSSVLRGLINVWKEKKICGNLSFLCSFVPSVRGRGYQLVLKHISPGSAISTILVMIPPPPTGRVLSESVAQQLAGNDLWQRTSTPTPLQSTFQSPFSAPAFLCTTMSLAGDAAAVWLRLGVVIKNRRCHAPAQCTCVPGSGHYSCPSHHKMADTPQCALTGQDWSDTIWDTPVSQVTGE